MNIAHIMCKFLQVKLNTILVGASAFECDIFSGGTKMYVLYIL